LSDDWQPYQRLFAYGITCNISLGFDPEVTAMLSPSARIDEIQPAVNELLSANLIMRRAHGIYGITDPFVQDAWLEQKQLSKVP
jgi:hypothetical protein